jgi:hypothetical protein
VPGDQLGELIGEGPAPRRVIQEVPLELVEDDEKMAFCLAPSGKVAHSGSPLQGAAFAAAATRSISAATVLPGCPARRDISPP